MAEFFPEVRNKPSEEAPNQDLVNPVVFLDISSESQLLGRIQLELFADTCPKLAEFFRSLCTGEFSHCPLLGYKQGLVEKLHPNQYVLFNSSESDLIRACPLQVSDLFSEGLREKNTYGSLGISTETNPSQFYITFQDCDWMDSINPCFGRIYPYSQNSASFKTLKLIETTPTLPGGKPNSNLRIVQCGQM